MVTRTAVVVLWLLRWAAGRWPAEMRDDLIREWTAEVRTIARDADLRPVARCGRMAAFGVSLALARPGRDLRMFAPLGWKRIAGVIGVASAYLLVLSLIQSGWYGLFDYQAEGDRPILDDPGLPARLVIGVAALGPVVVAAGIGWLVGRGSAASRWAARPASLGLCLLAVVAGWAGAGFLLDRMMLTFDPPVAVPWPPTMGYNYGSQPSGMITSWLVWLIGFVALAGWVRRSAGRGGAVRRVLTAVTSTVLIAGIAVTAGTFVQFGPSTAPRGEMWKWFGQWLVPANTFAASPHLGADSFDSARRLGAFVSSYPHVLLAIAAFGVALLLAGARARTEDRPAAAPGSAGLHQPAAW